jgi:hypothetical protein
MKFKVYPMREKGRRLEWRDVKNGPSYVGDLRYQEIRLGDNAHRVATLFTGNKPDAKNILPDLFNPTLTELSTLSFRLRGHERISGREGIHEVVQEWHCTEADD